MSIDLAPGQQLGRYELLVPIARGGMAQVWAAQLRGSHGFHKIVAVKTLLPHTADDLRLERMFLDEATLASQIHHRNVIETLDFGEHEGRLYLVMEWINGEPLTEVFRRAAEDGGLPLATSLRIVADACEGLHAAHQVTDETGASLGLVHRDVSPHNLLIGHDGSVKVIDFGVAKATARGDGLTQIGEIKGKLAYIAPEQLSGEPVDRRVDVFSVGVLLYLLTTGHHPFKAETAAETIRNISLACPRRPCEIVPDYPPELEAIVGKALRASPLERWESLGDLLLALQMTFEAELSAEGSAAIARRMAHWFPDGAAEHARAIRDAQRIVEQGGLPGADSGQTGTRSLRAVSYEVDHAQRSGAPEIEIESDPQVESAARLLSEPPQVARRHSRALPLAAAFVAMVPLGWVVGTRTNDPGAPRAPVSAGAAGAPSAQGPSAAPTEPSATEPLPPPGRDTSDGRTPILAPTIGPGTFRPQAKVLLRRSSAPASAAPAGTVEPPHAREASAPATSSSAPGWRENSWNAHNFGGRR